MLFTELGCFIITKSAKILTVYRGYYGLLTTRLRWKQGVGGGVRREKER